ncbi:tetratricopeptide (TPR) repeat protein [Paenibacillus sp. PvR052]
MVYSDGFKFIDQTIFFFTACPFFDKIKGNHTVEGSAAMAKIKKKVQMIIPKPEQSGEPLVNGAKIRYMGNEWTIVQEDYRDEKGEGLVVERVRELIVPDPPKESYDQLLEMEQEWERAEGLGDEAAWMSEGIALYNKMLMLQPEQARLKYSLAALLLQHGTHHKVKWLNRLKAASLFEQLLQLEPNHPLAHYHLGYIHWYDQKWNNSAEHFSMALTSGKLTGNQRVRAMGSLAVCYAKMGDREKAEQHLEGAWKEDTDRMYIPEIELFRMQIEAASQQKKVTCALIKNHDVSVIPYDEAEQMTDEIIEQGGCVLDMFRSKALFSGPRDTVELQPRLAALLEYLMKQTNPRTSEQMAGDLWEGGNKDTIRVYIQKLRKALASCLDVPADQAVVRTKQGYMWQWVKPSQLVVSYDPGNRRNRMLGL